MAPFGGALFWGQAAQSTDESMQEWNRLFQVEQDRLQREQMQKEQIRHEIDIETRRQAFERERAKARENFELGLLDRQQQFELGQSATEHIQDMDLSSQIELADEFADMGNLFAPVLQGMIRRGWFQNPGDAFAYVDTVFTAPLGTKISPWAAEEAFNVVAAMSGWSDEEREKYHTDYQSMLDQRASNAEELDTIGMEGTRTALQQARANVVQTEAETEESRTRTAANVANTLNIYQDMAIEDERREPMLRNLELGNQALEGEIEINGLEATERRIRNGFLPDQLRAGLELNWAQVREYDDKHELHQETLSGTVQLLQNQVALTGAEAAVAVGTVDFRIALAEGDVEHMQESIAFIRDQRRQIESDLETDEVNRQIALAELDRANVMMLSDLTARGDVELLGVQGAEILRGMGWDDATVANVLRQLSDIASTNRNNATKAAEANATLAIAQADVAQRSSDATVREANARADYMEWQAGTAEDQRQIDNQFKQEGLAIQWAQVDVARVSANNRGGTNGDGNLPAGLGGVLNEIRLATGIDQKEMAQAHADLLAAGDELAYYRDLLSRGNPEEIASYFTEHGISEPNQQVHLANLEARANSAGAVYGNLLGAYLSLGVRDYGTVLTPADLGITSEVGREVYRRVAPQYIPARELTPEEQTALDEGNQAKAARISEVQDRLFSLSSALSLQAATSPEGNSTIVGAQRLYNQLASEFGPDRLTEAGITPSGLGDDLGMQVIRYQEQVDVARFGINALPGDIDESNPVQLDNAATMINAKASEVQEFRSTVENLTETNPVLGFLTGQGNMSAEHGSAARRLIVLTEGLIDPWELHNRGIIRLDADGNVTNFLDPSKASEFLSNLEGRLYQSGAATRWLATLGGIRGTY